MHSMTEEVVSGHAQALPRPLSLDSVSALPSALSEDRMKSSLPVFKTTPRSENSEGSMPAHPQEVPQRKDGINQKPLTVNISGYGMLSEKLICPDASMPGHLDEMERRQTGLEEPQVAREASLGDSQRPVESAKTPDVSLFTTSHFPPHLEPEDLGEHAAEEQMCGAEDNSSLQLPVLQPEEIYVLRDAEIGEESVPPVANAQTSGETTASLDQGCTSDVVTREEQRNEPTGSTETVSAVPEILRKTPIVLLTRLSAEVLDACKRQSQASSMKTEDSHNRSLATGIDSNSKDRTTLESGNGDQSRKTKSYKFRSKLQERLAPLSKMLKQSNVWRKLPAAHTVSQDFPSAADVQLDENSNSEAGNSNFCINSKKVVHSRDSPTSKSSQSGCSGRKGADVLKNRQYIMSDSSLAYGKGTEGGALENTQTAAQDQSLAQPCAGDSDSKYTVGQLSRLGVVKSHKHHNLPGHHSKNSYSVPMSYTAYSPGTLKMTFVSCSKSSGKNGSKSGCDELETESGRSSSKEPSVDGWESCPNVIFDCSSHRTPTLMNTASDVSRNPTMVKGVDEKVDNELGPTSHVHAGDFLQLAGSQSFRSCSDQDETVTSTYHTELSTMVDDGSASLQRLESTAVPSDAAHGNAAESASTFVPLSSPHDTLCQTATLGSCSSRDSERGTHIVVSPPASGQMREPQNRKEMAARLSDQQSREFSSSSQKNSLNRLSPLQVDLGPIGTQIKKAKNGLKTTLQTKRLQRPALSSKRTSASSSGPVPPHVSAHNGQKNTQNKNIKRQSLNPKRQLKNMGSDTSASLLDSDSSVPVVTVHVNGGSLYHTSGEECMISCIEKTSPPFIIPHQDEKMVESDMVVMQKYYYSTLHSSSQPTVTTGSGCCQGSDDRAAVDKLISTHGDGTPQTMMVSEYNRQAMPTLIQYGQVCKEIPHEQLLSNQSHLENTGILMVNTNATKALPVKTSPGHKRTTFRSVSEDSDKLEHSEYKDVVLSSIVVDEKCFHTPVTASDMGSYTIRLVADDDGAHDSDLGHTCNAQTASEAEQSQQGGYLCGSFEAGGECDSSADQQNGAVGTVLQNQGNGYMEEMMVIDEDMLLQSFEGEIMGQVPIRQENDEYDEVFDIVNERDVPIPHEAFLHSLSLLRNTGIGSGVCDSSRQSKKAALSSFSLTFIHENMVDHEKYDYDSDATLPYPRDESRQTRRPNKSRKQRRSKKKKRKPARTTTAALAAVVEMSAEAEPTVKKRRGRQTARSKLIELPSTKSSSKSEEKAQPRKKSATRHPLFKQRHQAATRRTKDKAKTFMGKPTTPVGCPTKTPQGGAEKAASSPATFPVLKQSKSISGVSNKSSESDYRRAFSSVDGLDKEPETTTKRAKVRAASASGASAVGKSKVVGAIGNRATIAINSLPGKSPSKAAKLMSRAQKDGPKQRMKRGNESETGVSRERAGGIFEGTRLTDESDSDELPTIVPPKRRRQQTNQRGRKTTPVASAEKAASAAAAEEVKRVMQDSWIESQGSERIMREFPRHNWLEHKILQKNTYTPPAGLATEGSDTKGLSPPKASKRSELPDDHVLDRTHSAESCSSPCTPVARSSTTGMASCDRDQGQATMLGSLGPTGPAVPSWTTTASSVVSLGDMPAAVSPQTVSEGVPLVTSGPHRPAFSPQHPAPTTVLAVTTTASVIYPPNFLQIEQDPSSASQSAKAEERLVVSSSEMMGAVREAGQDVGRRGAGEDAAEDGHPQVMDRLMPMTCSPRLLSKAVLAPRHLNRMARPILFPISFSGQPARIPVIPFVPQMTAVPSIAHVTQMPVVTTVSFFNAATRQVTPTQPQIASNNLTLLPVTSTPPASRDRVLTSVQGGFNPSEILIREPDAAASSSEVNPYEESVSSPPDLSPGRLHIDIGDVSPSREESFAPSPASSELQGKKGSHQPSRTESAATVTRAARDKETTGMSSTRDVAPALSMEAQNVTNATCVSLSSSSGMAPAQASSSPMPRSKSSSALPERGWKEKKEAREKEDGRARKGADPGPCGGRRKSWEQTHKDLLEDQGVVVTPVQVDTSRSAPSAMSAVAGNLAASVTTSTTSTISTSPSSSSATATTCTTSSFSAATDAPVSHRQGTPSPPLQLPHHPQTNPPLLTRPSLPPPPSLVPTLSSTSSSSQQDQEGKVMVFAEPRSGEKGEASLSPGGSDVGLPLDLCTQKSDILGASRGRTHPPVQLVLPQVQPRSDVSTTIARATASTSTTTSTTITTSATATTTVPSPSSRRRFSPSDIIASTKLVLRVISESLVGADGNGGDGGGGGGCGQPLCADPAALDDQQEEDLLGVDNAGRSREAAMRRWRDSPTAGKASPVCPEISPPPLRRLLPPPLHHHLPSPLHPQSHPTGRKRGAETGDPCGDGDETGSAGAGLTTEVMDEGSAGASSEKESSNQQVLDHTAAQQESRVTSSQVPADPELSPQASPDSIQEERLRLQLRQLEQMAAQKMQEREQLLLQHKRKAEMLTEMESKRRRASLGSTCSSTAPEVMETSGATGHTQVSDSRTTSEMATGSQDKKRGDRTSSTDHTQASDNRAASNAVQGSQDRNSSERSFSEQLMALQRVLISALSTLPQAPREDSDGAPSQPRPEPHAPTAAPVSAADETGPDPSSGILDLSSSGRKERSSSTSERRPLVQMINQAIHMITSKQGEQSSEGTTSQPEKEQMRGEDGGSIRPAHQGLRDSSCPPSSSSVSPSLPHLQSPYTRRQMPLNEPPVQSLQHTLDNAPKSAHSQPPFQPAGSLIVPTMSSATEERPPDSTVSGASSQKRGQKQVRAGTSERQEEKGNDPVQMSAETKNSGVSPHGGNIIDLTKDNEDAELRPSWHGKRGAKGKGSGDTLSRSSRTGDIAPSSAVKVSQPVAPSGRRGVSAPVVEVFPEVSGSRLICPEKVMPEGGLFPPNTTLAAQGPTFHATPQQQPANPSTTHSTSMEERNAVNHVRPSGESNRHHFPQYREQQSGQADLRRGFPGSSENCLPQMAMTRMPGTAVMPQETHALDARPHRPYPAGHPGGARFSSALPPPQEQSLVLRNPMEDTHLARQSSRMAAVVSDPPEYLNKSMPQPQALKRHPGQTGASHTYQQQQEAAALQMQQQQHSPFLPSRQQLQQHLQIQQQQQHRQLQQQQQQQQQQHMQQQPHHQSLPAGHHVPHGVPPGPSATLSPTRPPGFTHMPRVPYSGVHPPVMPMSHLGVPCSSVPHSVVPPGVNRSEAHLSNVPQSAGGAHFAHFGLGGSVPPGVPTSHPSSFYSQGVGGRAGSLVSSAQQQLQPSHPSLGQHMRSSDMDHRVRNPAQMQAGVRPPPYFSAPRPPQPMDPSKRIRVTGPGGVSFPPTSQATFPLPSAPHHPPSHTVNRTPALPSPKQQVEVVEVSSAQQPSRPMAPQPHMSQQPVPSPPGRRKKGMCELCGAMAMYLCSLCRTVWYCSQECQSTHWRTHSTVCKQPKS